MANPVLTGIFFCFRAFGNFKRWFTLATYKMCTFTEMEQQGYSRKTTEYLKKIVQKAIRTLKTLKPLSCKVSFILC